ncbi:hypothetical protein [Aureimonas sp. N4]|uniref:hypothetical protein n=1 Tax=Aureimonas sp. N4 TaxID=1638165 RepID=UPI0007852B4E|nr:hypothetical protein [Aureimonas sp. N4]
MPRFATAGSKVYIGAPLDVKTTDFVAADFSSQSWVEIGGLTNIGSVGDTNQEVNSSEIGLGRDISVKGTANAGTLSLTCNIDTSDAGQIALRAAQKSIANYAFKIEFPDKPSTGASPKGSQRLFIGLVMGVPENLGGANQFAALDATVKINSNVVQVGPSAS